MLAKNSDNFYSIKADLCLHLLLSFPHHSKDKGPTTSSIRAREALAADCSTQVAAECYNMQTFVKPQCREVAEPMCLVLGLLLDLHHSQEKNLRIGLNGIWIINLVITYLHLLTAIILLTNSKERLH